MLVQHNDADFRQTLSDLYAEYLEDGCTFLDLGSSWVSHLPPSTPQPANVWLHGMNREELDRNPFGTGWRIVRSFNEPEYGFDDDDEVVISYKRLLPEIPESSVDVVGICAAFQYWIYPERVVSEIATALKPGGVAIVSFSNRMFESKVVEAWKCCGDDDDARLDYVKHVMECSVVGGDGGSPLLKVERIVKKGSSMLKMLTLPISMALGRQVLGDPFMAVVVRKEM